MDVKDTRGIKKNSIQYKEFCFLIFGSVFWPVKSVENAYFYY